MLKDDLYLMKFKCKNITFNSLSLSFIYWFSSLILQTCWSTKESEDRFVIKNKKRTIRVSEKNKTVDQSQRNNN